jgi:hypothetical protein
MKKSELKDFFRRKSTSIQYVRLYERTSLHSLAEDIEIAGFLSATIAWGTVL